MLNPRNIKYRKVHSPFVKKGDEERKQVYPIFGVYALKAINSGLLTPKQLEAGRKTIKKLIKKSGVIWTMVFPDRSITGKPAEVRMGKGKGAHDHWVAVVRQGAILFEVRVFRKKLGVARIKNVLEKAANKLPLKTNVIIYKT